MFLRPHVADLHRWHFMGFPINLWKTKQAMKKPFLHMTKSHNFARACVLAVGVVSKCFDL